MDSKFRSQRLYFLDSIRTFLTILVMYMHTCIAYGGEGSWAYRSKDHPKSIAFMAFNGVAQTFYMGTFFVISGYFSRLSLERKSPPAFVKDKVVRLGVPTVVYTLVGPPLQRVALKVLLEGKSMEFGIVVSEHWRSLKGVRGPVWYCALLLILDCGYAMLGFALPSPASTQKSDSMQTRQPGPVSYQLLVGIAISSLASFAIRLLFPITYEWRLLNLKVGYCPQYILAYILGLKIHNQQVWDPLPNALAWILGVATIGATSVGVAALEASPSRNSSSIVEFASGGRNLIAASYAIANETGGYLLFSVVFQLFRHFANKASGAVFSRYAYGAFLVHPVVSVAIEAAMDGWKGSAAAKLAVIGTMNVCGSWAVSLLLLQIPGMNRVI